MASQIVAVAAILDALSHDCPYKQARPLDDAVAPRWSDSPQAPRPSPPVAFADLEHVRMGPSATS
jgi:hypothetical protein